MRCAMRQALLVLGKSIGDIQLQRQIDMGVFAAPFR